MKRLVFLMVLSLIILLLSSGDVLAETIDVVHLKNGSIIRGMIVVIIPNETIKIETADGSIFVYQMDEVEKMVKEQLEDPSPTKLRNIEDKFRKFHVGFNIGYKGYTSSKYLTDGGFTNGGTASLLLRYSINMKNDLVLERKAIVSSGVDLINRLPILLSVTSIGIGWRWRHNEKTNFFTQVSLCAITEEIVFTETNYSFEWSGLGASLIEGYNFVLNDNISIPLMVTLNNVISRPMDNEGIRMDDVSGFSITIGMNVNF